jgi:hypothetical protein
VRLTPTPILQRYKHNSHSSGSAHETQIPAPSAYRIAVGLINGGLRIHLAGPGRTGGAGSHRHYEGARGSGHQVFDNPAGPGPARFRLDRRRAGDLAVPLQQHGRVALRSLPAGGGKGNGQNSASGSADQGLADELAGLRRRFLQRLGDLLGEQIQRPVQVCLVARSQLLFRFHPAQFLGDLGVLEWIAALDGGFVGIGSGLPLLFRLALPVLDLAQQFPGLPGGDQAAHRVGQLLLEQGKRQVVAREVELGVSSLVAAVKTSLPDGLDFSDAVLGVVNAFTFANVDGCVPL